MAKKKRTAQTPNIVKRAPVVVVMGHIDHGKSTLLDYIRSANVVAGEAGGITQHLSAYEAHHTTSEGSKERIVFLDTPGHAAFQKMRHRGADVADVAILVVSAEDGVKPQTLEALKSITDAGIPYVVAINKIDKPGADLTKTQASLIENEIYIEGMGGDISWAGISALKGDGVSDLLDLVVLTADVLELTADENAPATGTVIEGHVDSKRGNTATLIVLDGTLATGSFVVSGEASAPVRIMEDFTGKPLKTAGPATPVGIVGFTEVPTAGASFSIVDSKKEAEAAVSVTADAATAAADTSRPHIPTLPVVPVLVKADVLGSLEAIEHEIEKFESDRIVIRKIGASVGPVTHSDVQFASATENAIIVGFNVAIERPAQELAERLEVEIDTFDIIYDLSEWINTQLVNKTPKREEEQVTGTAKILKQFSVQKHTHVLGARVEDGSIKQSQRVNILRRDIAIGTGVIKNLQQYKKDTNEVNEGEFGLQLDTKAEIAPGDIISSFDIVVT